MTMPDFGRIKPREGSVDIHKDYLYLDYYRIETQTTGHQLLRLTRIDPERPGVELPLNLLPNHTLRVPCSGGYAIVEVRKVVGRIVELKQKMSTLPIPGHQVRRIRGYSQSYIDGVLQEEIRKGNIRVAAGGVLLRV